MRNNRPQSLETAFQNSDIQKKAIVLVKLNKTVKGLLPKQLQLFCQVANYRQGILIIQVANASWLNLLRYEQTNLIQTLRHQILPSLVAIEIQINPALSKQIEYCETDSKTHRKISPNSAQLLLALAEKSPAKIQLKLKRLANLAVKLPN